MGAWGIKNFENDTAIDWLNDFMSDCDISKIEDVYDLILKEDNFIDSDESFVTLAASEIILASKGIFSDDFPKEIDRNVIEKLHIKYDLIIKAKKTIYKILYFENHSELRELWGESEEFEDWENYQKKLLSKMDMYS